MGSPTPRALALTELEDLATGIDGPVMLWSNEVLIGRGSAVDAIHFYRSRGDVILGFEGFDTDGTVRTPRMDCIADLSSIDGSWSDRQDRSVEAALAIVYRWVPGPQWITFVVQRPNQGDPTPEGLAGTAG